MFRGILGHVPVAKCFITPELFTLYTGTHKVMVQFRKLTRNVFLILHGHNVHRQQQQLSKSLMCYQQFASHAYCGAAGPASKMSSQQEMSFCVIRFEVSRSVIKVQCDFRALQTQISVTNSSKLCTKLTLHGNCRSGHLKTEHKGSLFLQKRSVWRLAV
jgi:hypothetical protein